MKVWGGGRQGKGRGVEGWRKGKGEVKHTLCFCFWSGIFCNSNKISSPTLFGRWEYPLWIFVTSILFAALFESGYHGHPYHNSTHAADVTQAMHCYLQESKVNYEPPRFSIFYFFYLPSLSTCFNKSLTYLPATPIFICEEDIQHSLCIEKNIVVNRGEGLIGLIVEGQWGEEKTA